MLYVSKMARCCRLHKYSTITRCTRGLQSSTSQKKKLEGLLSQKEEFQDRHIGPREREQIKMLRTIGYQVIHSILNRESEILFALWLISLFTDSIFQSLDELTQAAVPTKILHKKDLNIDEPLSEWYILLIRVQSLNFNKLRRLVSNGHNVSSKSSNFFFYRLYSQAEGLLRYTTYTICILKERKKSICIFPVFKTQK